ncbi:FG-GAP-like repeat-containing protein [Kitasatospora sp. NPDC051170]|uniref:FG-GAP-like repeat-containing protein n=1 Tax=Kitasatospora sp. NPDC051170 TaxID=3364056 RepID=UPI003796D92E
MSRMRWVGGSLRVVLVAASLLGAGVAGPGAARALDAGPTVASEPLFAPKVAYKAGDYPFEVALGDFHGSGRLDIVASNNYDNTVSLFPGNGDGTFAAPATIPVGEMPGNLLTGRFTDSGRTDLAVAVGTHPVSNVGSVEVRLGNGDGTFQPVRSYPVGASPKGLASADLRGLGRLDLVTVNRNDNTASVLLGNGDGTFQPQHSYPVGNDPEGLALADLDGDGRIDLVAANAQDGTVSVLRGNGDGTFQPQRSYPVGRFPLAVAVGDLRGVGHPDLAVAVAGADAFAVLPGDGDGTFGAPTLIPLEKQAFPSEVAIADLDGDGHRDLVGGVNNANVSVLLGNGDGTFQPRQDYRISAFGTRVAIGDLNGDGRPDVVAGDDSSVDVLLNIARRHVTTTLTSDPDPSAYGRPVTLTATVCPAPATTGTPTGTVTFRDGTTVLGTAPVRASGGCGTATLATSTLGVGPHGLTAEYGGDATFLGATSAVLTQQVTRAAVVTTLSSSPDPASFGSPVTFTDTVCPAPTSTGPASPPTGTVTFSDGSTTIGTGTLAPGGGPNCATTKISWSHLLPGSHTVTAQYPGDDDYLPGAPESITQQVGCERTITGPAGSVLATGTSTCLVDATADAVVVRPGAALFVSRSTVGTITSRGASFLGVCASTVTGSVQVGDSTGFVVIGDPVDEGCAGNRIDGSVVLKDNTGGLVLDDDRIGGSTVVDGTTGAGPFPRDDRALITANTVGGSLACSGNTPPPGDDGRPNAVGGPRTGQCVGL